MAQHCGHKSGKSLHSGVTGRGDSNGTRVPSPFALLQLPMTCQPRLEAGKQAPQAPSAPKTAHLVR